MALFWSENQLVWTKRKKELKRRAHGLKNQDASQGSTQGFNLFLMSPNWFLGICTLDPWSKVGLTPSTFLSFWMTTLDYVVIFDLNTPNLEV
jgi:hypothetical protein